MPNITTTISNYLLIIFLFTPYFGQAQQATINRNNIEIARDEYGVPHVFAKTDAEAVYGIAWAQCEDNFNLMQDNLAIANGLFGQIEGKNGAIIDYVGQLFELDDFIEKRYEQDISPEMETLLEAYVEAVNRYANLHPKELKIKQLFPVSGKDVLKSYTFNFILMNHTVLDVIKVAQNKMGSYLTEGNLQGVGSNAMAYNKNITADGKTYLVANPHQPIEGPSSFWECSVHSEEGLEFYGVTFAAGGLTPVIGTNRHLGWTHTVNYEDFSDVFELKMHPTKKNVYEYDGEWITLEEKTAKMKVKVGPILVPISKKYYTSKYGPTMKNKSGYYAFRSNAFFNIRGPEQWYKMALAQNYDDFWKALEIQALTSNTVTYADFEQNILHLSNGILPKRNEAYEWRKIVPGNTSKNNWSYDEKYPVEAHPHIKNPACGYVFNSNNSPLDCTAPNENPKLADFPKTFGILETNTHRAKRFKSLIKDVEQIDYQTLRAFREDVTINIQNMSFRSFLNADDMPKILAKYPELAPTKVLFDKWDGSMHPENKQATVMAIAMMHITNYLRSNYASYDSYVPEKVIVDAFVKAQKFLMKHYNTLEIELGTVQRIGRGDADFPMYGAAMTLANGYFEPAKNGKIQCNKGDTFIMYARYGDGGLEKLETINGFGNSNKPDSPHYTSQLEMYTKKQTKTVELDVVKLKEKAVRVYSPE